MDPNHIAPVTLTGRFVRLEPLTLGHLDALLPLAAELAIWRWMPSPAADRASLTRWIEVALEGAAARTAIPFATVSLADGQVAGSTRFMNIGAHDGRVEIGATWLGAAYRRTPVNTEAKLLMMAHAFEVMGATRVELKTHALNAQSRAAIERIGGRFEGIHRKHMRMADGTMRDTAWYSIVDDEWPAVKGRLEARLG
ncbi:MAG: GNAT family N-acetyltransferase [Gemmatimonadetes bacterium]|nr:GNAT family N-acetyltransferase [Gemmatimonadota bacterium]MBI3568415.1 GNAT family N-acetyltransferase [Gemmatimonadota bacterium]